MHTRPGFRPAVLCLGRTPLHGHWANAPNAPLPQSEGLFRMGAGGPVARRGQQQCLLPKSKGQRRTQLSFLRLTHLCHQPEVQGLHLSPQPTVPAPRALEAQLPRGQERRPPLPLVSLLSWAGAPPCGHAAGVSGARRSKGPRSHHYLRDGFVPGLSRGQCPQIPRRSPGLWHPHTHRGARDAPRLGSGSGTRGGRADLSPPVIVLSPGLRLQEPREP